MESQFADVYFVNDDGAGCGFQDAEHGHRNGGLAGTFRKYNKTHLDTQIRIDTRKCKFEDLVSKSFIWRPLTSAPSNILSHQSRPRHNGRYSTHHILNSFSCMNTVIFWNKCHWNLLLSVQFTIRRHLGYILVWLLAITFWWFNAASYQNITRNSDDPFRSNIRAHPQVHRPYQISLCMTSA